MLKLKCKMSRAGKAVKNMTYPPTSSAHYVLHNESVLLHDFSNTNVCFLCCSLSLPSTCWASCVWWLQVCDQGQQTDHFSLIPKNFLLSPLRARGWANTSIQARNSLLLLSFTSTKEIHIGSDIPAFLITSQWLEVNGNLSSQLLKKLNFWQ